MICEPTFTVVRIRQGDTLNALLIRQYGAGAFNQSRTALYHAVRSHNPWLVNIDLIPADQWLVLPNELPLAPKPFSPALGAAPMSPVPSQLSKGQLNGAKSFVDALGTLSPADDWALQTLNMEALLNSGGQGLFKYLEESASHISDEFIKVVELYEGYKQGDIKRSEYYARRAANLQSIDAKMGVYRRLLTPEKSAREGFTMRARSFDRHPTLIQAVPDARKLSRVAKYGGKALGVVDLGLTAHKIATAETDWEQAEIATEAGIALAVTTGVNVAGRAALAAFVVATPIGWVGLVGIVAANVAISVGANIIAKEAVGMAKASGTVRRAKANEKSVFEWVTNR